MGSGNSLTSKSVRMVGHSAVSVSYTHLIERSIAHFRAADPEFGERIAQGVKDRRG